jgi:hypothetical protein
MCIILQVFTSAIGMNLLPDLAKNGKWKKEKGKRKMDFNIASERNNA